MLKPSNPLTTLRQFIRGVCALPKFAAAASELRTWLSDDIIRGLASERNEQRDRIADLERQLEEKLVALEAVGAQRDSAQQQLTAEREAHAVTQETCDASETDVMQLRAQLDAVTRCCGQRMNYSPNPSNGKPFWFCPECGKELRPDYPYAGDPVGGLLASAEFRGIGQSCSYLGRRDQRGDREGQAGRRAIHSANTSGVLPMKERDDDK